MSLATLAGVIFAAGVLVQRVGTMEERLRVGEDALKSVPRLVVLAESFTKQVDTLAVGIERLTTDRAQMRIELAELRNSINELRAVITEDGRRRIIRKDGGL